MRSTVDGTVTYYLVDKNRVYAQVLEESDLTGSLIVSYIYGDDLISQNRNGSEFFYHYDGLGSTMFLTNELAVIADSYLYEAFGDLLQETGNIYNNYLFAGEQFDPNIKFYYLRARYYDAKVGRFLTPDSFKGIQRNPKTLHKYLYTYGDPVNHIDPSGLFSLKEVLISTLIISTLTGCASVNPSSVGESPFLYMGNDKHMIKIHIISLQHRSPTTARGLINEIKQRLNSNSLILTIKAESGLKNSHYKHNIEYDPYDNSGRPAEIGLAHELIHELHYLDGTYSVIKEKEEARTVGISPQCYQPNPYDDLTDCSTPNPVTQELYTENNIRADFNISPRLTYNPVQKW